MGEHVYRRRFDWLRDVLSVLGWIVVAGFVAAALAGAVYAVPYFFGDAWPYVLMALGGVLTLVGGFTWLGARSGNR